MSTEHPIGRELPLLTTVQHSMCGIGSVVVQHQVFLQDVNAELAEMRTPTEKTCSHLRTWIDIPKQSLHPLRCTCFAKFDTPRKIGSPCKSTFAVRHCRTQLLERRPILLPVNQILEMRSIQPVAGSRHQVAVSRLDA